MFKFFDFYGVRVQVGASDEISKVALDRVEKDFCFFSAMPSEERVDIIIELNSSKISLTRKVQLFGAKMCRVYTDGFSRYCDYGGGAHLKSTTYTGLSHFEICCREEHLLYEMLFTALMSSIGEKLDLKSFHRVHALGMAVNGRGVLVVLPSGGGKSSLALQALRDGIADILSDECPLMKKGEMFPFPMRAALRSHVAKALGFFDSQGLFVRKIYPEKQLFGLSDEIQKEGVPIDSVLIGKQSFRGPRIVLANRFQVFWGLVKPMIIGIGLTQMMEHMLRFWFIHKLVFISLSRLREALLISLKSRGFIFHYDADAADNYQVLNNFIERLYGPSLDREAQSSLSSREKSLYQPPGHSVDL